MDEKTQAKLFKVQHSIDEYTFPKDQQALRSTPPHGGVLVSLRSHRQFGFLDGSTLSSVVSAAPHH
jgi:hypothetical protein